MIDQYVVTARFKDQGSMDEHTRLVTEDLEQAEAFDVSAYEEPWEVWLEHYIVDERREVIASRDAKILYPV